MIFWDTSALLKCYFQAEQGHAHALNLLNKERSHKGSLLLWPEAVSGIVRSKSPTWVLTALEDHLKEFDLLPVDVGQSALAANLIRRHALRGADAIHLAAALTLGQEFGKSKIRFATGDLPQARAALREGLKVIELRA